MTTLDDVLAHYGVKGMKWGVRKSRSAPRGPASEDHARASAAKAKAKSHGGTHALSNKELQDIVNRMNLEQQYSRLNPKKNPVKSGERYVKEALAVFGTASAVYAATQSPLGKQLKAELSKK